MQFSIGVEYALHCLLYLVDVPKDKTIGIKELAAFQGISESYLSKVFTKLKKAELIDSTPGAKGGYKLKQSPELITFWDVVEAIEGKEPLFHCAEIRQTNILLDPNDISKAYTKNPCTIKTVMDEAENQMKNYLRGKTLRWLSDHVVSILPDDQIEATKEWFNK